MDNVQSALQGEQKLFELESKLRKQTVDVEDYIVSSWTCYCLMIYKEIWAELVIVQVTCVLCNFTLFGGKKTK